MEDWLEMFIHTAGDYMPHKSQIHLSVGSRRNLFRIYRRHCTTKNIAMVSYETLRRTFNSIGDYVKIPLTKQFTKCDECIRLDKALKKARGNT